MKVYLRILEFAKPYIWLIPVFLIISILHTIFQVFNFVLFIPLLEVLFEPIDKSQFSTNYPVSDFSLTVTYFKSLFYHHFYNYLSSSGAFTALKYVCVILIVGNAVANVLRYISAILLAKIRAGVISGMRSRIFESITNLHVGFFTEARKGDIISRVTTDAFLIEATVISSLKVFIKEPLLMVGLFYALFSISPSLTWYGLAILPLAGGVISFIAKRLKAKARAGQESLGRLSNVLDETIWGIRIIKAFGARQQWLKRFNVEVNNYEKLYLGVTKRFELAGPISEFLGVTVMAIILLIGGDLILTENSSIDAPKFITFLLIFSQILNPLKAFSNSFSNIQRGLAAGERIFEIIDEQPTVRENLNPVPLTEVKTGIRFKNVSFAYEEEKVLDDISFELEKGKVIALVGPSGAGKSTIADLLPRFFDPTEGSVYINDVDLRQYELHQLRRSIGIVTQESILFNDTVYNNITLGSENVEMEKVVQAATIANAHQFIEQLEAGYHTTIGERGTKLSGGQRQRISIARAIFKNPDILILDEATSALDSASEKLVQEALDQLMKDRTVLVVAHRLSTIQQADEILVLDEGKIIQRGRHEELMRINGLYKKLIDMQSF